ncbi:MAG: Gfo/Idh/MocA family protein [Tepidisphaerales bacterium]
MSKQHVSRRQFLGTSSLAVAGAAALSQIPFVHIAGAAAGEMQVNIGLIGCGGRGTGAVLNAMGAATKVIYPSVGYHTEDPDPNAKIARPNIKVVALADLFEERLNTSKSRFQQVGCNIAQDHCFIGFEAYKKLLALPDVNYVICATPPHFRPAHLMAAVEAGKNVFVEKPVAVDVPGVKTVMAAGELATQKKLGIAAGTQRRHQKNYIETIKRLKDGAIGEIVYARCYWNGGQIWVIDRKEGWSDLEWQLRNWNYFTWLSGDHYVEQHVHNLDVMNWVLGMHPIRAVAAVGGRQVRTAPMFGQVFDHFAVEYEYPGGIRMFSQARQIDNTDSNVGEAVVGTLGTSNCESYIRSKNGAMWRFQGEYLNPYEQEHLDLIASISEGKPINEAQAVAESTMTGILGREAAYSGKVITWDDAMKSTKRLGPDKHEFGPYPVPPVAMPGQYKPL